ncbi:OmpA family protein [Hymenobacter psychrotolerans]|uniref:Outer membrane protein OmpA n=1 Tax=Hymenobacter psychrotolerans DSM 18569 TaxID=1121959 RepID=A0A1M6UM63_9BACT|nr:OmpA family protein [Hymenobacter psychrotolerans]SHK70276.1 Outer membrane protein OmpA [Hymenobacter psychrotolerans DSM 18569]
MRVLLTLVLAVCWLKLCAQPSAGLHLYTDAQGRFRFAYPPGWQLQQTGRQLILTPGATGPASAPPALTIVVLPDTLSRLPTRTRQDTLWHSIRQLPQAQVLQVAEQAAGSYQQLRYDYTYAADSALPGARIRVLGRRLWRGGSEYQLEYRAAGGPETQWLQARQLLESFAFPNADVAAPRTRAPQQLCDDKMYGIAALRYRNDLWEDDCRTIHEFSVADPSRPPRIHRQVLPFQSYALTKGFDNCLYSVTKAPTNAPEYVYRYDPATRTGRYTSWQLPAQGPATVWIAAATDERGRLFFSTSDASKLVRVNPADGAVQLVWSTDPVRQAAYYAAIALDGAGSHGNFCLDTAGTLYQVYSTDGSLIKIDLKSRKPAPQLLPLAGLPERGGYSDLLFHYDAAGRRRLYLAGPKALYWVDMASGQTHFVRRGVYTDLAGCNLFRAPSGPAAPAALATVWRGRVLDAATLQPLPKAQLQVGAGPQLLPLAPDGSFTFPAETNRPVRVRVQQPGYLPTDSVYGGGSGPYVQDILVQPLTVGTMLHLNDVQFEQGTTRLLVTSYPALDELLAMLKQNPGLTIQLRGHTDNVGDPQKNLALSEQRVAAVRIYLVGLGISPRRITGIGLGGAEPRASNAREATRKLNRRVEVRVTGTK